MKDTNQIYIENAKFIIENECGGNTSAFARKLNTHKSYIYQIFSKKHKSKFSRALAEKTEKAFKKPSGWMGTDHNTNTTHATNTTNTKNITNTTKEYSDFDKLVFSIKIGLDIIDRSNKKVGHEGVAKICAVIYEMLLGEDTMDKKVVKKIEKNAASLIRLVA